MRLAELAAIAVLLIGFGVVIVQPGLPTEARAAAGSAIVGALLLIGRTRRR